jgi:hypothetical protein
VTLLENLAHLAELQVLHQQRRENRKEHQHRQQAQRIPTIHILFPRTAPSRLVETRYVVFNDVSIM